MACYILTNCTDNVTTVDIDYAPGGLIVGNIICVSPALSGPSNCWKVTEEKKLCSGTELVITSYYDFGTDCATCLAYNARRLVNCDQSGGPVYININYTGTILATGAVISLTPMPADYPTLPNCWEVMALPGGDVVPGNYFVTSIVDQGDCPTCLNPPPPPACYTIINCNDTNITYQVSSASNPGTGIGTVISVLTGLVIPPGVVNCWTVGNDALCEPSFPTITYNVESSCFLCTNTNSCYTIENCSDPLITSVASTPTYPGFDTVISITSLYPFPPTVPNCWKVKTEIPCEPGIITFTYNVETSCEDCLTPPCYKLTSCTSGNVNYYYTNNPAFGAYVGLSVQIQEHPGCFTVELVNKPCDCTGAVSLTLAAEPTCVCTSVYNCYALTDCTNSSFTIYTTTNLYPYIGLTISVAEYPGICFTVSGISNALFCEAQIKESVTCVQTCVCGVVYYCYTLTNCEVDPISGLPITQIVSSLTPLPAINTVIIPVPAIVYPGVGNCWTVGNTYTPCNVSTGVTLTGFTNLGIGNCALCLGPPQCYKLTSCDQKTIVYSTSNLSAFVNNYIQTPLIPGTCFFVEEVESCSTPLLTITGATFCSAPCPVYTLTPCGEGVVLYTYSNLASYVGGLPIQFDELGGCTGTCYTVTVGGLYADAISVTVSTCTTACPICRPPVCYTLVDCVTKVPFMTLNNPTLNGVDLGPLLGQVVSKVCEDPAGLLCTTGCWTIATGNCDNADLPAQDMYVYDIFPDCPSCLNSCFEFVNCETTEVAYTVQNVTNPLGLPNLNTLIGTTIYNLCFLEEVCPEGCFYIRKKEDQDCRESISYSTVVSFDISESYCCEPTCYLLTECLPVVATPIIVNNDLSLYVGSVAKICDSEGNCKCYNVELAQTCAGAITIDNASASFTTCEECNSCGCPPGYTQVGSECQKITSIPAVQSPVVYTTTPGNINSLYGSSGTRFYSNVTALPFPLTAVGSQFLDAGSVPVPFTASSTGVWGGPVNSRLNTVGIWTTAAPNPINEWVGFTQCIEIQETGTYCIGIGGDDAVRLKLDGVVLAIASIAFFDFVYWHVFEVNLTAGTHIIVLEGLNTGGPAAFGAEIYQGTIANLQTITTVPGLQPITVFSTFPFRTSPVSFQTGETSGYSCPPGATLNLCGEPSCTVIETVPFVECAPTYKVITCPGEVSLPPFITNTDLSAFVGGTYKTCIENPEYSSDCYFLQDCNRIAADVYTYTDLSAYIWQTVQLDGYPGSCFIVNGVPVGALCRDAIEVLVLADSACTCPANQTPWPDGCYCVTVEEIDYEIGTEFIGVFTTEFENCEACLQKCYTLTACAGGVSPINVCNDLSQYVDKVIKITGCGDICWIVSEGDCVAQPQYIDGTITEFETCEDCLPPVPPPAPLVLHPRAITPGYFSPNSTISTDYIEKVNCMFAKLVYDQMLEARYGITTCCKGDLPKWDIKKQYLDMELLTDPSLCKSTLCYCPDPCFVSAIITLLPTCVAPYIIRATLDPLCYPPVVESVEITVNSELPCYCYTVEIGDAPVILGYIDCCCKDVIQVIDAVTTINMCAIYPPVTSEPGSTNVTSSGFCSDLCVVEPPVCVCWQVINTGYAGGLNATITYTPCGSETPLVLTMAAEIINVCSYNMPVGVTTDEPITVNNLGPCDALCNEGCKCFFIEFDEPDADFEIFNCETSTTEIINMASGAYICSGTVPIVIGTLTNLSIILVDPAEFICTVGLRCTPVPIVCPCWGVELLDGQTAIGTCGTPTSVTNNLGTAAIFYICSTTLPTPPPGAPYTIAPFWSAPDCSNVASQCNQPLPCYCWRIDLGDGQGAQGICGGVVNSQSVVKAGPVYLCSETMPTPLGAYSINPFIVSDCSNPGSICNNP